MFDRINKDKRTDIPAVLSMSREFHAEAKERGPFDRHRVANFLAMACAAHNSAMFVLRDDLGFPQGFLVAQCGENYLTGERIAEETAIFVLPAYRKYGVGDALLDRFEEWSKNEVKAKRMRVTAQWSLRMAGVVRWFGRRGFEPVEVSLTKEVTH